MRQQSSATTETRFITKRTISKAKIQSLSYSLRKRSLSWINPLASGIALTGLSLSLLASGNAEAVSFSFRKIVDKNTPIPGSTGTFDRFGDYSLDDGNIAFKGFDIDFRNDGLSITQGVYTSMDSELSVVADTNTPIPGGTGNFYVFANPSLDGNNLAFEGQDKAGQQEGIYTSIGGQLSIIADTNTPIPGGTGNFYRLNFPSVDGKDLVFKGEDADIADEQEGIYLSSDGKLSVIADTNTAIPGGTSNFRYLVNPFPDDGSVVFWGSSSTADEGGIYMSKDGKLSVIVDTSTPVPGGPGTFTRIEGNFTSDNRNVAFVGTDSFGEEGIYTNIGGRLSKVFERGDLLDGNRMTGFDPLADIDLSGNEIVFTAYFEKPVTEGIYVATAVPEPSSILGTLAFGTLGTGWMAKGRQRKQKLTSRTKRVEFRA